MGETGFMPSGYLNGPKGPYGMTPHCIDINPNFSDIAPLGTVRLKPSSGEWNFPPLQSNFSSDYSHQFMQQAWGPPRLRQTTGPKHSAPIPRHRAGHSYNGTTPTGR